MKNIISSEDDHSQKTNKTLIEKYSDVLPLRLIIQNIPYIGTSLDTLLAETGNKWREKRLQTLLGNLSDKLEAIKITDNETIVEMQKKVNTEDFYDLFLQAGQKSAMTHNIAKIDRFANILKNYITISLPSEEDYLTELFLNITNDLTETEVDILSSLLDNQLDVYYSYRDKPFDVERLQNDVSNGNVRVDDASPDKYHYDNSFMYSYSRLQKMDLIEIKTIGNYGGRIDIGYHSSGMSVSSFVQYKRKDEIEISEFGKKYIKWILE